MYTITDFQLEHVVNSVGWPEGAVYCNSKSQVTNRAQNIGISVCSPTSCPASHRPTRCVVAV